MPPERSLDIDTLKDFKKLINMRIIARLDVKGPNLIKSINLEFKSSGQSK